jgi:transposase
MNGEVERDHDADEPLADICPHCGSQGFDGQGHVTVGTMRMYRKRCWECGTRFAVEIPHER